MMNKGTVSVGAKWEEVKDAIFVGVANSERNQINFDEGKILHYDWEGLSFFCMLRQERGNETRFVHINQLMMKTWGCTFHMILEQGIRNMEDESEIIGIDQLILQLLGEGALDGVENLGEPIFPMYVFTNKMRVLGAAGAFWGSKVKELSKQLESNLFILPSSIHEAILIPDSGKMSVEQFSEMVREINLDQVPEEERLADDIYYYNRALGIFDRVS